MGSHIMVAVIPAVVMAASHRGATCGPEAVAVGVECPGEALDRSAGLVGQVVFHLGGDMIEMWLCFFLPA